MSELRYAFRSLRGAPWYSATVVGVIALGMALAATVFAVVDGVLFKPLPYPRATELFGLSPSVAKSPRSGSRELQVASEADLQAWRTAVPEVKFAAYIVQGFKIALAGESPYVAFVDAHVLDVLGQPPLIGGFRAEHFGPSGPVRPVMISYSFWQRAFNGDASIVGRTFPNEPSAGGAPSSSYVVGILAPDFLFPSPVGRFMPEVLMPMELMKAPSQRNAVGKSMYVIARVPGDRPVAEVERRLGNGAREVAKLYPPYRSERPWLVPYDLIRLVPIREALTDSHRTLFSTTFLTAAVLILLVCVNVTGLAGARLRDREQELAVRRALGASRVDLLRLSGLESALTIGAGTVLGALIASPLLGVVRALMPTYVTLKRVAIDARVVGFCVLASVLSVTIVTLWPGPSARHERVSRSLAGAGTTSRRQSRGRAVLIAAQIAIALVLVLGGTLFTVSLERAWQEDAGVRTDHAYRIEVTTKGKPQDLTTINSLIAGMRRVPGVIAAGGLEHAFLQQIFNGSEFSAPPGVNDRGIESLPVTAGFMQAAGLDPVAGRLPTDQELETGAPVIVVSRRAAARFWPGESPVGQILTMRARPFTVVGVVPNVRYRSLDVEPEGEIYWPLAAEPKPLLWNLYLRIQPDVHDALGSVLRGLSGKFPEYQILNVQTAAQTFGEGLRQRRFQAWLFGAFAVAALVIVGVGMLGLLAMTTARRTREIGIRLALGGSQKRIITLLVREQLPAVFVGLAAGGAVSAWGVRFVQASLYHVTGDDLQVWTIAVAAILIIATMGALLPALGASRTDPVKALRVE